MKSTIFATGGGWGGDALHGEKVTTAAEILAKAGLDFTVEKRPIYFDGPNGRTRIDGQNAIVRTDTGAALSVMSDNYGILQARAAVDLLDSAAGLGECCYSSAGAIDGGSKIFVTARLPDEIRIGRNDVVKPYLMVANSFDGSIAATVKALSFRPICENTFAQALRTERETEIKVRHTANVEARMASAVQAIKAAHYTFETLGETFKAMAATRFSDEDMANLARILLPTSDETDVPTRTTQSRETMSVLFSEGAGQKDIPEIRGTVWAAFNAVTAYADHLRPTRTSDDTTEDESRFASALFGGGAAMKMKAFQILSEPSRIARLQAVIQ